MPPRRPPAALLLLVLAGCGGKTEEERLLDRKRDLEVHRANVHLLVLQEANGRPLESLPAAERDRLGAKYGPVLTTVDVELADVNRRLREDRAVRVGLSP